MFNFHAEARLRDSTAKKKDCCAFLLMLYRDITSHTKMYVFYTYVSLMCLSLKRLCQNSMICENRRSEELVTLSAYNKVTRIWPKYYHCTNLYLCDKKIPKLHHAIVPPRLNISGLFFWYNSTISRASLKYLYCTHLHL